LWAITASSENDIRELTEARTLIEVEMAGLAAQRFTPDDLAAIGRYLDRMKETIDDRAAFLEADLNFHLAIGNAAHSRILMNALHLIRNLMRQWIGQTLLKGASSLALRQHKEIFVAIAKRNPESARAAMQEHLTSMARFLQEVQQSGSSDGKQELAGD
jgi:GntR family transcriptional repressor for pyruvate dehydrogenase complex